MAGSVLIASLTASFLTGITENPDVPQEVSSHASVELESGAPFISDADLQSALEEAGVSQQASDAVLDEYGIARVDGLRTALALLALFSVVALFFTRRVPTQQPGAVATVGDPSPPGG